MIKKSVIMILFISLGWFGRLITRLGIRVPKVSQSLVCFKQKPVKGRNSSITALDE